MVQRARRKYSKVSEAEWQALGADAEYTLQIAVHEHMLECAMLSMLAVLVGREVLLAHATGQEEKVEVFLPQEPETSRKNTIKKLVDMAKAQEE